jgi:hypothetical protein
MIDFRSFMFKKECVKIEVKGKEGEENLPVECCMTRNGKPTQSHFVFRPRVFPQLSNYVLNLNWNSVSKTIKVDFNETPNFEVYEWIKYIQEKSIEVQKSPFSDLDANCLSITFQDSKGKDVADVKFKNLSIADHNCSLVKASQEDSDNPTTDFLVQTVVLGYQYTEFLLSKSREDEIFEKFPAPPQEAAADQEWQTVEAS